MGCFLFHDWKYYKGDRPYIYDVYLGKESDGPVDFRVCRVCGKKQMNIPEDHYATFPKNYGQSLDYTMNENDHMYLGKRDVWHTVY